MGFNFYVIIKMGSCCNRRHCLLSIILIQLVSSVNLPTTPPLHNKHRITNFFNYANYQENRLHFLPVDSVCFVCSCCCFSLEFPSFLQFVLLKCFIQFRFLWERSDSQAFIRIQVHESQVNLCKLRT